MRNFAAAAELARRFCEEVDTICAGHHIPERLIHVRELGNAVKPLVDETDTVLHRRGFAATCSRGLWCRGTDSLDLDIRRP